MPSKTKKKQRAFYKECLKGLAALALMVLAFALFGPSREKPASTRNDARESPSPEAFVMEPDETVYARYAGSESCRECHQKEYDLWAGSHHALAERSFDESLDRSAFNPEKEIEHGSQVSRAHLEESAYLLETLGKDKIKTNHPLTRVIGVDPLRQFMVREDSGRYQVTELAWDPHKEEWFDVYGEEDRQPGEWGHWTGGGMNWNSMCANCHNTRLRKHYDPGAQSYETSMAEMGVGCEACHGPMKDHVDFLTANPKAKDPHLAESYLTPPQMLDTCGSCHSRRAELTGDFAPGDSYADHFALTIPDESDIFYPDGQVRDEDYEFTSFLGSKMHAAGVHCMDCHEPHSGKRIYEGDLLCMRCHSGAYPNSPIINPLEHSFHLPGTKGSQCVDCHMPLTTYMQRHPRRDHGFTIPDPLLTKRHGIPNACNRCHSDQSVDWALQYVENWYGGKMDRYTRDRAQWIARAREGESNAYRNLLKIVNEDPQAFWKAVAVRLLRGWTHVEEVRSVLAGVLAHENSHVRGAAVFALDPILQSSGDNFFPEVRDLLDDPARRVRVDAAWALRRELDPETIAGRDLMTYLNHNLDQPTGLVQMGVYHLDRGDVNAALSFFEQALEGDSRSAALRHEYAVVLSMAGRAQEAVRQLKKAVELEPNEAEFHYKLALALNETGDLQGTIESLETAVSLNPQLARAWYNLGLAHSSNNQPYRALEVLARGESLNPQTPDLPYVRATILAQLGQAEAALETARGVLDIDPNYSAAINLIRNLQGASGNPNRF